MPNNNQPYVSKVTVPFVVKSAPQPGPHRPTASTSMNAMKTTTPTDILITSDTEPAIENKLATSDAESNLISAIDSLWAIEKHARLVLKKGRFDRAANQCELARQLAELKALLVGRGRGGQWHPYLKKIGMPRSTAEDMVQRHRSGGAKKKSPADPPEPTSVAMPKLAKSFKPKLVGVNTREKVDLFMSELAVILEDQIASQRILTSAVAGPDVPRTPPAVVTTGTDAFEDIISIDDQDYL